jgi:hypothetical protein
MRIGFLVVLALFAALSGCDSKKSDTGDGGVADASGDAGADAAESELPGKDVPGPEVPADGAPVDAALPDVAPEDGILLDKGTVDQAPQDAAVPDAADVTGPDLPVPDSVGPDGQLEVVTPDAEQPDVAVPDAGQDAAQDAPADTPLPDCWCDTDADCGSEEVCEPYAHRCIYNPCVLMKCAGGPCDPYTGTCIPPEELGPECSSDADCLDESACGSLCNPYTKHCQVKQCCLADCMWSCSDLIKGCFQCLDECDCPAGKTCDGATHLCVAAEGCNTAKIQFDKDNPQQFELYELCMDKDYANAQAELQDIDPGIACGTGGAFAKCDKSTQVACLGELPHDPDTTDVTDDQWARLCQMSQLDFVILIAGGHYL